jgi:N-acetyl-alpha-D-muramate 1-phosphate uridylyltransferase
MLTIAILSGGLATRLRPITETIPKSLVDVAGKPFIVRQLEYLRLQGYNRVVLCVGYLGEQIEAVVQNGSSFGMEVCYSQDGPGLLGTGGAIINALPLLGEYFFVFYGDSYLPCDFNAVELDFYRCGKPALMTVLRNANKWDKSNVLYEDGRIVEYNKRCTGAEMSHIDYGLSVLSAAGLAGRATGAAFDLADVFHELSVLGQLSGHEVFERFYEIGSHKGLEETINFFLQKESYDLYATTFE